MKIGILSMQKVVNYGSFLQAFALKKTLESLENEVEFIDILPGNQIAEYKITPILRIKKIMKHFFSIYAISRLKYFFDYKKSFVPFFEELGANKHSFNNYDCAVIGSDEVFNIAQPTVWGYTSQLFGNIPDAKKIISYAGSFGQTNVELMRKNNLIEDITKALKNMSAISVRDENSKKTVENLLQKTPSVNIDPVLLFDFSKNIKETQETGYIIVYSYPNRIKDKKTIKAIKIFAQKHKKRIYSIGSFYEWADDVLLPHPFEVLSYFKNADYIVTDTFHGTIMSIKYNKQFVTIARDTNRNKLEYLLESMKLEKRIFENYCDIENILLTTIDYSATNAVIDAERQKSLNYLKENL